MGQSVVQVDAFANGPFTGNPAAVCVLSEPREESWMQRVAMEMNLAETAFLISEGDGWRLRWFTPAVEVDLCGHATIASAHALWEQGPGAGHAVLKFYTRSGLLTAARNGEWITLDFPARPPRETAVAPGLVESLGVQPRWIGNNGMDYLVEVDSEEAVRAAKPDFAGLLEIDARGVIVTARSANPDYHFVSRFFAPRVGVNEDPVTGSAHCCLAPYWGGRLSLEEMTGYQASARGGVVKVALRGERVLLSGKAVTVMSGSLSEEASL